MGHSSNPVVRNAGVWTPYFRLDGSEYHAKIRPGGEPSGYCVLVVDHYRDKDTADEQENSVSSCEEAYFSGGNRWLFISHSSQTAWYLAQRNGTDMKTKRKLYWSYIAAHPAHASRSVTIWITEAHKQALVYLRWCSFEALTSSRTKTPFPLKHSQDLANLLKTLDEESLGTDGHPDDALSTRKEPRTVATEGSSKLIDPKQPFQTPQSAESRLYDSEGEEQQFPENRPEGSDGDHQSPAVETAAEESFKLRVVLIAKVLLEKYSQQGAVEAMNETNPSLKPSRALDALFWIVDVTSLGSFLRYLTRLDEVRDTLLTDDQWRDHILRLVKEWEEFNLISTVLLSASAGILALENIGGVPRTAILISILSSFGSITTGLYCITMYQPRAPNSRDSVDRTNALTIFNYTQYTLTHKSIAMILGLPMAFLVWSLVSFMVGILSYNIVGTEISGHVSGVAYAVISVAAIIFLLILLAFYSLARLWGSGQGRSLLKTVQNQYRNWRPLPENEKITAP